MLARLGARMPADPNAAPRRQPPRLLGIGAALSLHDRLLAEAGSAWDDWGAARPAPASPGARRRREAALAAAFTAEFGEDFGLAVLKDPRICRFVPLWRAVLAELGAAPGRCCPLRHPLEVAGSLARRDGMAEEEALLLWLRHMLEAEAATRACRGPSSTTTTSSPTGAPSPTASPRRSGSTGRSRRRRPPPTIAAFLAGDLRHHAADPTRRCLPGPRRAGRRSPRLPRGDAGARPRLDALRAALDAGDALMGVAARRQARRAVAAETARAATEASAAATAAALRQEAAAALVHHEAVRAALAAHVAELEAAHGAALVRHEAVHGAALAAHAAETAALEARAGAAEAARAAEAAARIAEREAFLSSRSWRMTAPLRRFGRILGRDPAEAAGQPGPEAANSSADHGG